MRRKRIGKIVKYIVNFLLCIAVSGVVCFLAFYIYEKLQGVEVRETGSGWEETITQKETDTAALFDEMCRLLETELSKEIMHVDSVLVSPGEYNIWDILESLEQVKKEDLTQKKQLLYDKLAYCCKMCQKHGNLPEYTMIFSEILGPLNTIPEIFYTCQFTTKEDIEEYFIWLKHASGLFEFVRGKIQKQKQLEVGYPEEVLEKQILLCEQLISEEGVLSETFKEKVSGCEFLEEKEKYWYIQENQKIIEKNIVPVMLEIEEELETMKISEDYRGLCTYAQGRQYFDYLLECNTGSGMNAEEMYFYLDEKRKSLMADIQDRRSDKTEEFPTEPVPEEIVSVLYENTRLYYPVTKEVEWEIYYLPEYLDEKPYAAFFTKGIGNNGNYIYVNGVNENEGYLYLYQMLAHEAFPGHMYWYSFEKNSEFPLVEELLKCLGYSEGWAVAAEFAAGAWLDCGDEYRCMVSRKLLDELFLCQSDIGIHAYGWDVYRLQEFMEEVYGQVNEKVSSEVFQMLTLNAGAYEAYVVGYYQFMELQEYCCMELEMNQEEFYRLYAEAGQTPFPILKEYMENYQKNHY